MRTQFKIHYYGEDGSKTGYVWHRGDDESAEASARSNAEPTDARADVQRPDGTGYSFLLTDV